MSEKLSKPRRRGRRAGVFASLAAVASMLVTSVGAAPAQGATQTAWIPLFCGLAGSIPVHVGASLTTTLPDTVAPSGQFNMVGTHTEVIFPPAAQQSAAVFGGNAIQGIVTDFETNLAGGTVNFAATAGGATQTSPTQFNSVRAVQPPNAAASNPRINGGDTTRGGFQPATPAESFSFGDAPADTSGASGNSYAPAPGVGGGFASGSGTADNRPHIGPITAGASGSVIIKVANPGGPDVAGIPAGNPRVATNTISFHTNSNTYTQQFPADCALDTSQDAVAKPDASWVDQFEVPIEAGPPPDGVGTASARGTDPDAVATVPGIGTFPVSAQFSAITNCDENSNTRPFIAHVQTPLNVTITRTSTQTSTCHSEGGTSVNEGTGTGTVSGDLSGTATFSWRFEESPDAVHIEGTTDTGASLTIDAAPPASLNGSPGGVWVFGTLPWPAGGGV
jgi:hypothetical protein